MASGFVLTQACCQLTLEGLIQQQIFYSGTHGMVSTLLLSFTAPLLPVTGAQLKQEVHRSLKIRSGLMRSRMLSARQSRPLAVPLVPGWHGERSRALLSAAYEQLKGSYHFYDGGTLDPRFPDTRGGRAPHTSQSPTPTPMCDFVGRRTHERGRQRG